MAHEPLFWCVWCDGGGNPTVKHPDFITARKEAQRLAREHPGKRFVVLAAAVAYQKRDLDEVRFSDPHDHPKGCECDGCEIPF